MAVKEYFAKFMNSVEHILPGGNKIDIAEKMIFIFLILDVFQYLTKNRFTSLISNNIQNKISYIINFELLDVLSSFVVFIFAFVIVVRFIELRISKFIQKHKYFIQRDWYINEFDIEYFSLWFSKYYVLYLMIYIFIDKPKLSLSLLTSLIGDTVNFYVLLNFMKWGFIIEIAIITIVRIIGIIFIERTDYIEKRTTTKSKIAEDTLNKLYADINNNPQLNYFDEKTKALHIINDEIELLKIGVDIEEIEKKFKNK